MDSFDETAQLFKILMHPARLAILDELRRDEACVCHLEAKLGYRQAYISQQLAALREAGLIQDRREGWNIYYRVIRLEVFDLIDAARRLKRDKTTANKLQVIHNSRKSHCPCPKCNPADN